MSKHVIPFKIEVTLRSQDNKSTITKRIYSDQLADWMTTWQDLFWYIVKVERKEW